MALLVLSSAGFTAASAATNTGPVGGKYRSSAYLAVTRTGAAVYVNALVHQDSASGLAASPNRTVYLQRQLSSGWQNMLSRRTDAHGRFTVGFLSAPSYPYRLIALANTTTWNATSSAARSPLLGGALNPGQSLIRAPGAANILHSPTGEFSLSLIQGDEITLSQDAAFADGSMIYSAATWIMSGPPIVSPSDRSRLTMLTNGDLALISAAGKPLWSSHTSGAGNTLYVQNDGNMVIYNKESRAVWATHTTRMVLIAGTTIQSGTSYVANPHPQYDGTNYIGHLIMQRDGNLVLYGGAKPTWSSNTHLAGSYAAFTVNGTLAVFSPGGTVLWRSTSYGIHSAVMLDCGRLEFLPRNADPQEFPSWQVPASCRN
ncbi:MAG: hypothetical protein ABI140_20690 [Jatrophihabitantaceae bacterium]